jgi:hypothetical protein
MDAELYFDEPIDQPARDHLAHIERLVRTQASCEGVRCSYVFLDGRHARLMLLSQKAGKSS